MPLAHCPHALGDGAGSRSLRGSPCQGTGRPSSSSSERGEGSAAGLLAGVPPLLSPSLVARQQPEQRMRAGSSSPPPWEAQPAAQPNAQPVLPAPWPRPQPAPRQTALCGRLGRGHRLLSPFPAGPSPPHSQAGPRLSLPRPQSQGPRAWPPRACGKTSPSSRAGLRRGSSPENLCRLPHAAAHPAARAGLVRASSPI